MSPISTESVYFLLSELCEKIYNEFDLRNAPNETDARRLKSKCFEVLLKKSANCVVNTEEECDPLRELHAELFELSIRLKNSPDGEVICDQFKQHLKFFQEDAYFSDGAGRDVLICLLKLRANTVENHEAIENISSTSSLLIPGPFTLHASYDCNPYYPKQNNLHAKPLVERFKELQTLPDPRNPYLPRFLFHKPPNQLAKIDQKYEVSSQKAFAMFSGVVKSTWDSALSLNPFSCKFFGNVSTLPNCCNIPTARKPKIHKCEDIQRQESNCNVITTPEDNWTLSWDWEHLGSFKLPPTKPFCTESQTSLHLNHFLAETAGNEFCAKIVSVRDLISDLKSLTIGIQSDTFQHDDMFIFRMVDDITIADVSPTVIDAYVLDFLECGTCYKRLQIMASKKNYKLRFDGFIFKALCSAVEEYLITFRNVVLSITCNTLSELICSLKNFMKQVVALAYTLAIHPSLEAHVKPPMGSQFLGYLHKEITHVTQKDVVMLLIYILRRCCHVYFKHLQKWIFYGLLDDPCNEMFICFVDHYRPYTKYFFDKAYFVRRESVPGFFQGFEDQILQCGKYAMLLKAFKPNHTLFDIEYPVISVCLSYEEIETVTQNCRKYVDKARDICGRPVTIRDAFNKRMEKKKEFFKMVSEKSRRNMEEWTANQAARAALIIAEKKRRLEEIHIQLQAEKDRKIAERKANLELDLKVNREREEIESKQILRENLEIQKRIEYYEKLNTIMEERSQRLEQEISKSKFLKSCPDGPVLTSGSSTTTEFDSCWGDEENESGYEDCLSADFIDKFKQTEEELMEVVMDNKEEITKPVQILIEDTENDNDVKILKKSESDYFNSNEVLPDSNVLSELAQNRNKILGCSIESCFSEARVKVDDTHTTKELTEAQKIKFKVLMQEFGYELVDNMVGSVKSGDINSNPILEKHEIQSKTELTDLERNRQRMMQNDTFAAINSEPNRRLLNLDLNSERSKNRRKVLESEFHILTGESTSVSATPMSTTSDSSLFDDNKMESGSSSAFCSKNSSRLTVDIAVAKDVDIEKMQLDIPTAVAEETPECALNTAGLNARKGFDFTNGGSNVNKSVDEKDTDTVDTSAGLQVEPNDNIQNALALKNLSPYKRCEELVKSNFKCKPLTPFFTLKLPIVNSDEQIESMKTKKKHLSTLSAITLTEFLQKSVTIPLSAHLEVMNSETMRIYLEDLDIIGHFKSLRNYFFLMDGEFGSFISDGLITKLERGAAPTELFNYQMLHTILDNALGSSIMGNDKNAENLSFIVTDLPEKFDLSSSSVLENLCLSYRVSWPVNLILNPEALDQYANIFKYLMKVRRISWLLEEAFQMLKEIVKKCGKDILLSPQYRHVQQIRHKFFHFVHALRNHITSSALQASWKTFKDDLISARTIEDIYRKHANYIKRINFLCMLNRRSVEFYNNIENIFKVSIRFYRNLKSREWKRASGSNYYTHSKYEKLLNDETEFEKLIKYTIYLGNKIVRHGYQEEIGEFITLINFNYYYVVDA